ncbi:hypothetical protein [Halochromatium sp.]
MPDDCHVIAKTNSASNLTKGIASDPPPRRGPSDRALRTRLAAPLVVLAMGLLLGAEQILAQSEGRPATETSSGRSDPPPAVNQDR